MKKHLISLLVILLLVLLSIMPVTIGTVKNTNYFPTQSSRNTVYYPYFDVQHNNCTNESKNDIIEFNAESNESIFIIKVSNPHQILLEHLSWNIKQDTIGKKCSSGAFVASCQVYDVTIGNYLNCIMETFDFGGISEVKLQYLHYQLGQRVNYTYDNRALKELDNESIFLAEFDYPFVPSIIPPGTWYLVFSSIIFDLEQTDVSTKQSMRVIFSGNCSNVNISTKEGGKGYGFWYGEYTANVIASKSNMLELMINGKKSFHVENTLFYWYFSFPMYRGFWNLKWITPNETKTFNLLVIHGRLFYNLNNTEGVFYGMGKNGDYQIITNYLDSSRTIWGSWSTSWALYPIFVGLDVTLP
ncbi:MAG: hypothetical protein WC525_06180 [Candidatus Thermoplasmatota archaeon]